MDVSSPSPGPLARVKVPASTSNLGPGFDLLGAALSLHLEVEVLAETPGDQDVLDELAGEARTWPRGGEPNHLLRALASARGEGGAHYVLRARSEIPVGRGLGSSGSAIAAGLLLGDALAGIERAPLERLREAVRLEGHPDNVAASLLGGCTLCHPTAGANGAPLARHVAVAERIGWAVAWPEQVLSTEASRAALPREVPFAQAMENPRRLALLLEGLRTGEAELLRAGGIDQLHVPYRLPAIRGAERAIDAAARAGAWLVTLSGSGSSLVALGPHERMAAIAAAMAGAFQEETGSGTGRVVELVRDAPTVQRRG